MNRSVRHSLCFAAAAASISVHSASTAQQTRFGVHGIFTVYREERSCTLYADFPSGTMMRLSDRRDEGRAYVNFVNRDWQDLKGRGAETLTLMMMFPEIGMGHVTSVQIYTPDDGRLGYAGGDLDNASLLADFAASDVMVLSTIVTAPAVERERFDITGSGEAFRLMRRCSARYFPPGKETGIGDDAPAVDADSQQQTEL